jgi:hypothetical protein
LNPRLCNTAHPHPHASLVLPRSPQTRKLRWRTGAAKVAAARADFCSAPTPACYSVRPRVEGVNGRTVWVLNQSFDFRLHRQKRIRIILDGFRLREQSVDVHISVSICVVTESFTRPTVILGMSCESTATNRNQYIPTNQRTKSGKLFAAGVFTREPCRIRPEKSQQNYPCNGAPNSFQPSRTRRTSKMNVPTAGRHE